MSCFDPTCACSNAPKCKCTVDWDIRCVCMPTDLWNCPVRVNTAVWLIDNDYDLHIAARNRDFEGIKGWFDMMDDEVSFHRTVSLYCDQMIDELCESWLNRFPDHYADKYKHYAKGGSIWIQNDMIANECKKEKEELWEWKIVKIESEFRITSLTK